jgi:nitrate/nitrite transporter NarK
MYDAFGNYTAALTVMGVILAVCLVLNWWVNSKKNVERIQQQIAEETAQAEASDAEAA